MDIGRCFKDAWNLLMKDLAPLAVTAVIAAVVIGVVALLMGLVAGSGSASTLTLNGEQLSVDDVNWGTFTVAILVVVVVGLVVGAWEYQTLLSIMLRRVREDRAADMGDLRLGLEGLGGFIVAMLVLGIVVGIGFVLLIVPGLILMTIWAYVLVLIADKRAGLGNAMSDSSALAKAPGYLMTFVTLLVGGIVVAVISGILQMIPLIGQILGLFVGVYLLAYVVAMYFQATGETALLDHALYDVPLPAAASAGAGYPLAPAAPIAGTAYPPAPSAPMGGTPVPPPPPVVAPPPPPAPPPPVQPESAATPPAPPAPEPAEPAPPVEASGEPDPWAAAADPLAASDAAAGPTESEPPPGEDQTETS